MSERYDAVVIGAGPNGLAAAALLAKRGRKTMVVERREMVGGLAASEEFHPGYRTSGVLHDTSGLRPWVVAALELDKHGLVRRPDPPPVLVPQREGPGLVLWRDPQRAAEELAALSPGAPERYADYRAFVARLDPVFQRLTAGPPPDLFDPGAAGLLSLGRPAFALRRLGRRRFAEVLRVMPTCVADWLGERFESELLKAALAAPAIWSTYTGPRSAGSTTNLLLAETTAGTPVAGGARGLVAALERAAAAHGVEILTSSPVDQLRVRDGRVVGVRLGSGERIEAPAVLASCDPKRLFLRHLPPELLTHRLGRDVANLRTRGTAAKIDLALSAYPEFACRPGLVAESIRTGESLEEQERAFDAVKYRRFSERPILDVQVPTVEASGPTSELAPTGHHVFSILVHFAPYRLDVDGAAGSDPAADPERGWSEEQRERLYQAVMRVLAGYAPGIEGLVVGRRVLTPRDFESQYGVTGGHLHHGEHAIDQLLVRPTPETARYRTPYPGLYLCGSGSHPGGGLTCAPGVLGARAALAG